MYGTLLRVCLRVAIAAGIFSVAAVPLACKEPADGPQEAGPEKPVYDEDYAAALNAANLFCEHWLHGDYPVARLMLTRRLRYKYPEQQLRDLIGGVGNPLHVAYEVYDGRKLDAGRIAFKVRFFQVYVGQREKRMEAPLGQLVLIKEAENNWLVDEFPIP